MNYIAVLAATIASMALGMFWFSPAVFGTAWMKAMGFTKKSIKKMKLTPQQAMAGGFITTAVSAYVLALFIDLAQAGTAYAGAVIGFWVWLGFVATTQLGSVLWADQKVQVWYITAAHTLVSFAVMGAILAVWP